MRQAQSDIALLFLPGPRIPVLIFYGLVACMPHPGCQGELAAHTSLPFLCPPSYTRPLPEEKKKGFKPGMQGTPGSASGESSDE